jgi:hypothetical protein
MTETFKIVSGSYDQLPTIDLEFSHTNNTCNEKLRTDKFHVHRDV